MTTAIPPQPCPHHQASTMYTLQVSAEELEQQALHNVSSKTLSSYTDMLLGFILCLSSLPTSTVNLLYARLVALIPLQILVKCI